MSSSGQVVYGSLFIYAPNKIAPIIFAILCGLSTVGHFYQCFRYKCFKMIALHPFCAALFALGYALREVGASNYSWQTDVEGQINNRNLIIYVLSQVFVYIAPPLLELANYYVLGRVLLYIPYMALISPSHVLSKFGLLIAIIEIVNALGVSFASNPAAGNQGAESAIIIAALDMQLVAILVFALLTGIFHRRIYRAKLESQPIRVVLTTFYCSIALILVQSTYRLVEHLGNTKIDLSDIKALKYLSPIMRYKWYFYVFKATIMFLNSILWNVFNPGRFLLRDPHTYLARDGVTELLDDQKDDRSIIAKIGSVVSFGCFFRHRENRHFEQLRDHELSKRGTYGGIRSTHRPTPT